MGNLSLHPLGLTMIPGPPRGNGSCFDEPLGQVDEGKRSFIVKMLKITAKSASGITLGLDKWSHSEFAEARLPYSI